MLANEEQERGGLLLARSWRPRRLPGKSGGVVGWLGGAVAAEQDSLKFDA